MKSILEYITETILYHGSPHQIKELKPNQAKGLRDFENQNAIFLTDSKLLASLYAVSKHLKGKTVFSVYPNRIIIVGNFKLQDGYVYEVDVKGAKNQHFQNQWTYNKPIDKFKNVYKINAKDMEQYLTNVDTKDEMFELIKQDIDNSEIELVNYDPKFHKTIPENPDFVVPLDSFTIKHTILYNGKKAGICAIKDLSYTFWQIRIHPNFRGLGILEKASILLAEKYNKKEIIAAINKDNIASIKAHIKAGFVRDIEKEQNLNKQNLLNSENNLYSKKF